MCAQCVNVVVEIVFELDGKTRTRNVYFGFVYTYRTHIAWRSSSSGSGKWKNVKRRWHRWLRSRPTTSLLVGIRLCAFVWFTYDYLLFSLSSSFSLSPPLSLRRYSILSAVQISFACDISFASTATTAVRHDLSSPHLLLLLSSVCVLLAISFIVKIIIIMDERCGRIGLDIVFSLSLIFVYSVWTGRCLRLCFEFFSGNNNDKHFNLVEWFFVSPIRMGWREQSTAGTLTHKLASKLKQSTLIWVVIIFTILLHVLCPAVNSVADQFHEPYTQAAAGIFTQIQWTGNKLKCKKANDCE